MNPEPVAAGTVAVACPSCGIEVTVPVSCRLVDNEDAHTGGASLVCEPDTTDLWAHMWTHSE